MGKSLAGGKVGAVEDDGIGGELAWTSVEWREEVSQ